MMSWMGWPDAWLSGTHDDGAGAIPHTLEVEGGTLRLSQRYEVSRTLDLLSGGAPAFDLVAGTARPFALAARAIGTGKSSMAW